MRKPKSLSQGDTVALVSPSSELAGIFPHRLEKAKEALQNIGFETKEYPTTRTTEPEERTPERRAQDLMEAFKDPEIDGIISTIGGLTANTILPLLDFDSIAENPKFFCGYSDITVLHYALLSKANLSTFYGPCAITQFGEHPEPLDYTLRHFRAAYEGNIKGKIEASEEWTEEVLDWGEKEDLERPRKLKENRGYTSLRGGRAEGELIGGCLPSLLHLQGTPYWPDHQGKIMFLELPEGSNPDEGMDIREVEAALTDLQLSGVLGKIKGLIVGRPYHYEREEEEKFKDLLLEKTGEIPILYGADIGHTDPQITIPYGAEAKLDSSDKEFQLKEEGVL